MSNFIERNSGLIEVLAVCGTILGSMFIRRKHQENVNEQRMRYLEMAYGIGVPKEEIRDKIHIESTDKPKQAKEDDS
jgi:hypothetical protein